MRRLLRIAACLSAALLVTGTAAAADSRARLIDGIEKAIADEQRVLKTIKHGFHPSSFVSGSGDRALQAVADLEDDLRAAHAELALEPYATRAYLSDAQRLSTPLQQQAQTGVANLKRHSNAALKLDQAAMNVPLHRDARAYADDSSSDTKRAKVQADLAEIKHDIARAMESKNTALDDAKGLPPPPPPTKGSGSVSINPKYGPDCGCLDQYHGQMTLDQAESNRSPGFGIVLPAGYTLTTYGGSPGHGCTPSGAAFSCEWEGPYTDPANNAYQYNVTFAFGTNPSLAPADSGKIMACYGPATPAWSSPPPAGCFFLSGP